MTGDNEVVGESSQPKTPQHMSSMKVELKSFTGNKNLMVWQMWIKHVLMQQAPSFVLAGKEKKSDTMMYVEWEGSDELAR